MTIKFKSWRITLFIAYIAVITIATFLSGNFVSPERLFIVFLTISVVTNTHRDYLKEWSPFLFVIISYDFLRGLADNLNTNVHYQELINVDLFIFKKIPTNFLQDKFYSVGHLSWYDYYFAFLYFLHFVVPLAFAYLLWTTNKKHFRIFTISFLILSFSALITFVIFPAAPPWLASEQGYFQTVERILLEVLGKFPAKLDLPSVYNSLNPNHVAATPSLHTAFPLLVTLFSFRFFGKKSAILIPYLLSVWFALLYFGEHYFIDLLAGIVYTLVAFALAIKFTPKQQPNPTLVQPQPFSEPLHTHP